MGSLSAEEYFYKVDNMVMSSSQFLRKLFQSRWKETTSKDWEHTEEQGKLFLESQVGEKVEKNCKPLQKKLIGKGYLDEWDMSLLSMVLQNFGDQNCYKVENEAVRQLTRLRNELAHHPTKKLNREEYNIKVHLFRENLLAVRAEMSEIEKVIAKAGISSSVAALEATKKLLEEAETHMNAEEFEKAVPFFDEATTMPSLLPVHEGAVYEKRAECYFKWANYLKQNRRRNDGDKCVEQAMKDATLALELNENSWKSEFLIGQCNRWNSSYTQAIQHYSRALALSPIQKHVKRELDSCKILAGYHERHEIMDPLNYPVTLSEIIANLEKEAGIKLTEKQLLTLMKSEWQKGEEHAFRGYQYMNGWSVELNMEEAARHFAKAAKVGSADGIYNLALCYEKGKGVPQDLQKTYELFLQAANMSPNLPGIRSGGLKNLGVVSAQQALGLMFHAGVYVEQDFSEAVKWYEKAVENGCGSAAHNLGLMYYEGQGLPRNKKKAEMYWNQAVILNCCNSAKSLMNYYISHLEPDKARVMFHTGKKMGNEVLLGLSDEEFDLLFKLRSGFGKQDMKNMKADVIAFERKHKLDPKGMTFYERLQRRLVKNNFRMEKALKYMEERGTNDRWGGQMKSMDFDTLYEMACQGSVTAQNVMEAVCNAVDLCTLLDEKECESDSEKNDVLELLYKCCTGEFHVSGVLLHNPNTPTKSKVKRVIGDLFNSKCGEKGEEDMKIRYCYVCFNALLAENSKNVLMMEILKQGIKMYPDNVHYYNFISNFCGLNKDFQSGLEWADKGLQKFPTHTDLLYSKAALLRLLPIPLHLKPRSKARLILFCKKVTAYDDFIKSAPLDHRHVPEAFYAIAEIHIAEMQNAGIPCYKERNAYLEIAECYYNTGREAEGRMLSCYLPYGESDARRAVETALLISRPIHKPVSESGAEPSSSKAQSQPTPIPNFERKQYLTNPVRKRLIVNHRQKQKDLVSQAKLFKNHIQTTKSPKLRQTVPKKVSSLKPITLAGMNPTSDHVYEDRIIDLTIIDDPCFGLPSIHLIAEDENGDVTRISIYNVEQNKEAAMNLAHGSTIAIMNPYMRIGKDTTNAIRNDEPSCVIYLDKFENMCRCCGEENAQQRCSKCKKACYCSKECQEMDWKLFKHKLICSINKCTANGMIR